MKQVVGRIEAGLQPWLPRARRSLVLAPLMALAVACGGSSASQAPDDAGGSASGGRATEDTAAGSGGTESGASGAAGTSHGATAGAGGAAGGGGAGGAGAVAGIGAAAGWGGTAGTGGRGGDGGSGGMGIAGSPPKDCHASPPRACSGGPITLSRTCVDEASAVVGTTLPSSRCQTLCESMFADCSVQSVQQASITIECVTRCPTHQ